MPETLDDILRRVASGELSPAEAEPLIASASRAPGGAAPTPPPPPATPTLDMPPTSPLPPPPAMAAQPMPPTSARPAAPPSGAATPTRTLRLQVVEGGRPTVDLRIPTSLASLAGDSLPGLSHPQAQRIAEAIRTGVIGKILEVQDEDGDGVVIFTE